MLFARSANAFIIIYSQRLLINNDSICYPTAKIYVSPEVAK